jgi:hypothetical protein
MAWYKTGGGGGKIKEIVRITESDWNTGGGPSSDVRKYEIVTISTGGGDASVKVIKYDSNDVVLQEVLVSYKLVTSTYVQVGAIEIGYPSNWKVQVASGFEVAYNGTTYTSGQQILTWTYDTTVDYTDLQAPDALPYPADNSKIYLVTNNTGDMVKYQYQGSRRLLRKQNISDYEFWYEDLMFPIGMSSNSSGKLNSYEHYYINTWIQINSTANRGRPWQLEFCVNQMIGNGSSSEGVVFGTPTNSNQNFEFYLGSNNNLYLYGTGFNDDNCGDVQGKDVVMSYENDVLTVTVDGVVTKTKNYSPSSDDNVNTAYIANYRGNYCFSGMMNYIGFKWLD